MYLKHVSAQLKGKTLRL